jgi:hypothetical protein
MTLAEHAVTLIAAIRRAASEHGAPNSFTFGELETFYGGPPAMVAGRAAREWVRLDHVTFEPGRVVVAEGYQ